MSGSRGITRSDACKDAGIMVSRGATPHAADRPFARPTSAGRRCGELHPWWRFFALDQAARKRADSLAAALFFDILPGSRYPPSLQSPPIFARQNTAAFVYSRHLNYDRKTTWDQPCPSLETSLQRGPLWTSATILGWYEMC